MKLLKGRLHNMQIDFTKEEAQAVVTLISRADIKGGEAPIVVALMSKFQPLLKPEEAKPNVEAE